MRLTQPVAVQHDRALVALDGARRHLNLALWHLEHVNRLLLAPTYAATVAGFGDGEALQSAMDAQRHTTELVRRFTAHQKEQGV
jgi:hypothetical protein